MKTNYQNLAMRDPAAAALVGAIQGDDFGVEFAGGMYSGMGIEFGQDDWTLYGAESINVPAPTKEQALSAFAQMHAQKTHAARRARILEPNAGSPVKIETYFMNVSQDLTLGTNGAISASQNPATNFRPQRVVMNAPAPGFATVSDIKASNVSAQIGGTADAFMFSAQAVNTHLDLPTLTPANSLTVTGNYTGFVPTSYVAATTFKFCAGFVGPASVIA